jgi:hypothetical protein
MFLGPTSTIGEGRHGKVYEASWKTTTRVAVKELISYEDEGKMINEITALA